MGFRHFICIVALLCISGASPAFAKHVLPPSIEPIVHDGVRYIVPNDNGLRAYVEAWDVQTGRRLWTKTVFRHWYLPVPFSDTECTSYEYVASMRLQRDKLILVSERGREYELDMRRRTIRRIRDSQPNKGASANRRSVSVTEWPCGSWPFLTDHQALTAAVAELLR
jgi:hypothetical protein